jgi:hypothetical protein
MKIFNLSLVILAFVFLLTFAVTNASAQVGKLLTVNDASDSFDVNPGDHICADSSGKCTLRAAVQESNVCCFQNTINFTLPPSSVINLTLGELQITRWLNIIGPGAKSLTIQRSPAQGTPNFRIFHITTSQEWRSFFRGFRIKNGNATLGGGLYLEGASKILLTDVALTDNTAFQGGAIYNEGTLCLTRSLVNSNSTSASSNAAGGGIYNAGAQSVANLVNSTLTQNTSLSGGAVFNAGNLLMINDTISHNAATVAASSVYNAGTANILNTIIGMDNTAISSLQGAFVSMSGNLITDARNSTGFTNGTNGDQVSDNNAINLMLGALADNGGETETRALLAGSPAINHGNNCVLNADCPSPYPWQSGYHLQTDQRTNHKRASEDTVDVGAVESNTTILNLNGSWSTYNISPRLNGCMIVTTNAMTNEKQYRPTNPFGNFEVSGLVSAYVYLIERQCKRAGNSFAWVADFEPYPF